MMLNRMWISLVRGLVRPTPAGMACLVAAAMASHPVLADDPMKPAPPARPAASPLRLRTTADIPGTPELHALIDTLAGMGRVESAAVGPAGMPSQVHATFRDLAAQVDRSQALELAFHQNTAVRAYFIDTVLSRWPGDAASLYPLLKDDTSYSVQNGCMVTSQRISDQLSGALCRHASSVPVQAVLERGATDKDLVRIRTSLLSCLAMANPERARPLAMQALEGQDRGASEGAIGALGVIARNDPDLLEQMATHSSPAMRSAAVQVIVLSGRADTFRMLQPLSRDSEATVRAAVAGALGKSGLANAEALLEPMLGDKDEHVREAALFSLADLKTPTALSRVLADLRPRLKLDAPDKEEDNPFMDRGSPESGLLERLQGVRSEAVTALMRDIVARSHNRTMLWTAVQHLGDVRDRQSIPLIRRKLYSDDLFGGTLLVADALADLEDTASIPRLENDLDNSVSSDAVMTAQVLVRLGDTNLRPHLEKELRRKDVQFSEPLRDVLRDSDLDR